MAAILTEDVTAPSNLLLPEVSATYEANSCRTCLTVGVRGGERGGGGEERGGRGEWGDVEERGTILTAGSVVINIFRCLLKEK